MIVVEADQQAVWDEYERWRTEKEIANKRGAFLTGASILCFFLASGFALSKNPGLMAGMIFRIGMLAAVALAFIGGAKVAQAKVTLWRWECLAFSPSCSKTRTYGKLP